jgi:cation diffusion facilitator family transporter
MAKDEKHRVVVLSFFASLGLAIAKLLAGLLSGSLGVLSEALHSLVDTGATAVTWFAVNYADKPADDDHHYGHAKAESVAALIEAGLLFLMVAWIAKEAVSRIWGGGHEVEITWWVVGVIVVSIIVDFNRSRALRRVAEKTASAALEADALHFSSDMWSSIFVLAGLAGVWLGYAQSDAVAALLVAAFIAHAAWQLAQKTLSNLLDRAPDGVTAEVRRLVEDTQGILRITSLRLRPAGPAFFASVVVEVPRTMPIDDIVGLKHGLEAKILAEYPDADLTVTANPVALDNETVFQRILLIASRRNLAIHHLNVQEIRGQLAVSFDLEVDGRMALATAHEQATALEAAIRAELGPAVEVESHIEPQPERLLHGKEAGIKLSAEVETALIELSRKEPRMSDVHSVRVRRNDEGLFVHYHCRFAPQDTVDVVHAAVDRVENALQQRFPKVIRVIAHTEPVGHERHAL